MTQIAIILPDALGLIDVQKVWKTVQNVVGGFIEIVQLTEPELVQDWRLVAYVNEDGIAQGLAPCVRVQTHRGKHLLFGPVVIVRERFDAEGNSFYADVTVEDLERIRGMVLPFIEIGEHTDSGRSSCRQ